MVGAGGPATERGHAALRSAGWDRPQAGGRRPVAEEQKGTVHVEHQVLGFPFRVSGKPYKDLVTPGHSLKVRKLKFRETRSFSAGQQRVA